MLSKDPSRERDVILDAINEGVFTVDRDWRITSLNRAAEQITGVPRERALGQLCREVLHANVCEESCALEETMRTGQPIMGRAVTIVDAKGHRRPISVSTAILKDEHGEMIGGVETFRDLSMLEQLRKEIHHSYTFEDIISSNSRMRDLFDLVPTVAESPSTVLIEGESGTGKELFARAIHNLSPRKGRPFVPVNCGALPDTLLESELFGYKAGAFTDAKKDKLGRIARAEGGTLFLDEIGDVSPALQARLLRFLEDRVYEPLGAVEPVTADVRIIAATNKDLQRLVRKGTFRDDLYYRINVVRLELPPLRERLEDVPLLVEHFIGRLNGIQGKEVAGMTDDALASLMSYEFPGNVRELANFVERAFVLCRTGQIAREHLPDFLATVPGKPSGAESQSTSLDQMEAAFLLSALRRNDYNRAATARELGVHRSTLFRKIKALGLRVPSRRRSPGPDAQ